jgi:Skp family chaperone for outer membrane proteins
MKKTSILVMLTAGLLATGWCYRMSMAQTASEPTALKIVVVNVAKVLSECQANLDREKQSKDLDKKVNEELQKIKADADAMKEELESVLKIGSKEYNDRLQEWFNKRAIFKARQEGQKEIFSAETQAWMETLYQKLLEEVAKVARQEGATLVLDKDDIAAKPEKIQDLYNIIRTRKVLYSAPTLDLTAKILENMDRQYEQEKAGKTAP